MISAVVALNECPFHEELLKYLLPILKTCNLSEYLIVKKPLEGNTVVKGLVKTGKVAIKDKVH